jgi:hypothetical protein
MAPKFPVTKMSHMAGQQMSASKFINTELPKRKADPVSIDLKLELKEKQQLIYQ